ncbi:Cold shock protein (fragment) [Candidatus Terasakiella magnetica]
MARNRARRTIAGVMAAACSLSACSVQGPIKVNGEAYMPQWVEADAKGKADLACRDPLPATKAAPHFERDGLPLSPGDTVKVNVPQGENFTGLHVIDADGTLKLPFLAPIQAAGIPAARLESVIADRLVGAKLFRASFVRVAVQPVQWAPAQIWVAGAVFQPGQLVINERKADERSRPEGTNSGDYAPGRTLSSALRNAGGVRPDANLAQVTVERAGKPIVLDMRGALTGDTGFDLPLVAGDRVTIPSRGCFQEELMKPSSISPPGVRVYVSNLTTPAYSNSLSAVNKDSSSFPYGTRLLQALISSNCVGGNPITNADRVAVLVTTNPATGKSEAVQRSIEDLVREPNRDDFNPYLLPNDGIACYEGGFATFRDVARAMMDFLAPVAVLGLMQHVGIFKAPSAGGK